MMVIRRVKNFYFSIKTKVDLTIEILETAAHIQENYPELIKFEDEMTITIPDEKTPEITVQALKDYNDSLQAMIKGYSLIVNR